MAIIATVDADIEEDSIKPREWLLPQRFLPKFVTLTVAFGGAGKSTLATHEMCALATGRGAMCHTPGFEIDPCNSWYIGEDPIDDLKMRFCAATRHHGLSHEERKRIHYSSFRDNDFQIAHEGRNGVIKRQSVIDEIIGYIKENEIRLLVVDPWIHFHALKSENDNITTNQVVQIVNKDIAEATNCCVHIIHHNKKPSAAASSGGDGDSNNARGARALVDGARIAQTLGLMDSEMAEKHGVSDDLRLDLIRLDDAKGNMFKKSTKPKFYRKSGYALSNGDSVAVMDPWELPEEVDNSSSGSTENASNGSAEKPKRGRGRPRKVSDSVDHGRM